MNQRKNYTTSICLVALLLLSMISVIFIEVNKGSFVAAQSGFVQSFFQEDQVVETSVLQRVVIFFQNFIQLI